MVGWSLQPAPRGGVSSLVSVVTVQEAAHDDATIAFLLDASKAILNDLGMRAIKLRCDAKAASAGAETRFAQENTARESEVFVRARPRKSKRGRMSRVPTESNQADIGTKHLPSHRLEFLKSLMGKNSENVMTFRADPGEQHDESAENSDDGQHG